MIIRKTNTDDVESVLNIYSEARKFMRKNGNMEQWNNGYPNLETVLQDIKIGCSYVVLDESKNIVGVFAFLKGPDITYQKIYSGNWINNQEYYVIHRIAVLSQGKGIAGFIFDYCSKISKNLRIDTHRDNIPMQNCLKKNGFKYCGIIYLLTGDERLAFQKEVLE